MNKYEQALIDELKDLFLQADLELPFEIGDYKFAYNTESFYITYQDQMYSYGYCERGKCEEYIKSKDKNIVLFYPVKQASHTLGFGYELEHRRYGLDSRIMGFGMELYYCGLLDKYQLGWREKLFKELEPIMIRDNMPIAIIQKISETGEPRPLIESLTADETIDLKDIFTLLKCSIKPYFYRWK